MDLDPSVLHEWQGIHGLSRRSLRWIEEHADVGDLHPIVTAIAALRAGELGRST